jgi:Smg protein
MKENMLDVLFYLFENYPETNGSSENNKEKLQGYLQNAGFLSDEIQRAFVWLEKLTDDEGLSEDMVNLNTYRIFSTAEKQWINADCQGHIYFLQQAEILNTRTREQVINQIIALEDHDFDLDKLKWVVLMVLINRPDEEREFVWIDSVTTAMDQNSDWYH